LQLGSSDLPLDVAAGTDTLGRSSNARSIDFAIGGRPVLDVAVVAVEFGVARLPQRNGVTLEVEIVERTKLSSSTSRSRISLDYAIQWPVATGPDDEESRFVMMIG
jgi:hypothetical protein